MFHEDDSFGRKVGLILGTAKYGPIAKDDPLKYLLTEQDREAYRKALFGKKPPNSKEVYKAYREKTVHEDNLINFRTSWFVTLQAFLFTSFALSLGKLEGETAQLAPFLFGGIGLAACIATLRSVHAAHLAIEKITKKWTHPYKDKHGPTDLKIGVKYLVDPIGIMPAIKGGGANQNISRMGSVSSFWLPIVVAVFWLLMLNSAHNDYQANANAVEARRD